MATPATRRHRACHCAVMLIAIIAASCGNASSPIAAVAENPAAELVARCGSVEFTSVPPDISEFPLLDNDASAALDELFNGPSGVEAQFLSEPARWSIAERTDGELVLLGEPEAQQGNNLYAIFDRRNGAWTPSGWGGCDVQIGAPGFGPATVAFAPDAEPESDATQLSLLINERACASGQAPDESDIVVLVTETAESVSIISLVAERFESADCPGNPWVPVMIELDAPLGARQLLDAHQFPAQPVGEAEL